MYSALKQICRGLLWTLAGGLVCPGIAVSAEEAEPVDFVRDVKPILESHCFECHGPDSRKGGLNLTSAEGLALGGDSGDAAVVAHDSASSPLIQRIGSDDPSKRMPPKGPALSEEQVAALIRWVDGGAVWPGATIGGAQRVESDHWAFNKPEQVRPPEVSNADWVRNPIDRFVLARLEEEGLSPSKEADKRTLIRRASLDLIGLPPTPDEVEAFVRDERPDAYERLVERLLASPHYGERQAIRWLDAARYADTNGYEKDRPRSVWPWRDWVIDAYNEDMPFDRFAIEQLAGDLLPNATDDQRVATGFLRNSAFNEEGGVDVEEFRYEGVVDRTNTVSTVFLGLTMSCAQCHTHKYDPITQREYYEFMAFFNNQNDAELDVKSPDITRQRLAIQEEIDAIRADLANRFPVDAPDVDFRTLEAAEASSEAGAAFTLEEGGSILVEGDTADKDRYSVEISVEAGELTALRLDALPHDSLGSGGPGQADNGNFVLSEFDVEFVPEGGEARAVKIVRVRADVEQDGFPASAAIDGKRDTGWAIVGGDERANRVHTATFTFADPLVMESAGTLRVTMDQQHGGKHTLGRFRLVGLREYVAPSDTPDDERRAEYLHHRFAAWQESVAPKAREWAVLEPVRYESDNPTTFEKLNDRSLLMTGDIPNNDTYTVEYFCDAESVNAIRLEVLPHESLPGGGPGRGVILAEGDFLLSEIHAEWAPWDKPDQLQAITLEAPTADYEGDGREVVKTLDGRTDTGWSVKGGEGEAHWAVWQLPETLEHEGPIVLKLKLDQIFIHQHTIGRFRVAVSGAERPVEAAPVPSRIEAILAKDTDVRSDADRETLLKYFLSVAPELADERAKIAELKASMPEYPTSLVLAEREDTRTTRVHHRGEFLSPRQAVSPDVPDVLPPMPENVERDRLTFAQWLVDEENPLTARVTVNRIWQTYFGKGLVDTPEDFGLRSAGPSHPALLDWLAVEFMRRGWSMKELTRMIVTSATYRQSSRVSPDLLERDPANVLLARGPRHRVDAEIVRDIALAASGLLTEEIGGPSVFPPVPEGVLNLAYDGKGWETDTGPDRFRRGLYTYWKRTIPYPMATVFDAPLRDSTCVRRIRSNTPLQSLTLLNGTVFVEAAQAMARRVMTEVPEDAEARLRYAFMLCLGREPDEREREWVLDFCAKQLERFANGDADAAMVAPDVPDGVAQDELAAWTVVCRALLNLDETITKT